MVRARKSDEQILAESGLKRRKRREDEEGRNARSASVLNFLRSTERLMNRLTFQARSGPIDGR